jgi:8-oxo-dGTP pyrophosphatase MutT (NUDIX family)
MTTSAPIRPAATVIVLRDTSAGIEVFLVRRHHAIAFMGNAYVFPGGRVETADGSADASWCDGVGDAERKMPGLSAADALAFQVAGLRELFEEAGVMVARQADGGFVSFASAADRQQFQHHRDSIRADAGRFRSLVEAEQWRLALDVLVPFAHWVTPPIETRRFDTRFFVISVPPGQTPVHDGEESTASVWLRPGDALAGAARGEVQLAPPTWASLRELQRFTSVEAALSWARVRRIHRREPRLSEEHGVRRLVLPGDSSYPEPEPVAFETRFVLKDGQWRPESV